MRRNLISTPRHVPRTGKKKFFCDSEKKMEKTEEKPFPSYLWLIPKGNFPKNVKKISSERWMVILRTPKIFLHLLRLGSLKNREKHSICLGKFSELAVLQLPPSWQSQRKTFSCRWSLQINLSDEKSSEWGWFGSYCYKNYFWKFFRKKIFFNSMKVRKQSWWMSSTENNLKLDGNIRATTKNRSKNT